MKILFVIDGLGTGGAERSLMELVHGLRRSGVESIIVHFHVREEGVEQQLKADGFDLRLLSGKSFLARALELRKVVRSERPDLMHTVILGATLVGRLAALRSSVPVLTTIVTVSYSGSRVAFSTVRPWKLTILRALDGWTARHLTSHFHAISEAVKRAAVTDLRVPPEQVTVIHRGREPARLGEPGEDRRSRARLGLGLREDDDVVIAVGRQEVAKGHRFLLEAVPLLAARRPRSLILIAGRQGHATSELGRLADRAEIGDRVRFLGHREDVPDLLAAADVFAFPSLWEGLGGSLLEAMALGLPIVASDLAPIREVVDDGYTGRLVPPGEAGTLAAAIADLLDDPAAARMLGAAGKEKFHRQFTSARSVDLTLGLYERLTGRSPGSIDRTGRIEETTKSQGAGEPDR